MTKPKKGGDKSAVTTVKDRAAAIFMILRKEKSWDQFDEYDSKSYAASSSSEKTNHR